MHVPARAACLASSPHRAVPLPLSLCFLGKPIASLAFHVSADVLAIGCGHKLYMWEYMAQGKLPVIGASGGRACSQQGGCWTLI